MSGIKPLAPSLVAKEKAGSLMAARSLPNSVCSAYPLIWHLWGRSFFLEFSPLFDCLDLPFGVFPFLQQFPILLCKGDLLE